MKIMPLWNKNISKILTSTFQRWSSLVLARYCCTINLKLGDLGTSFVISQESAVRRGLLAWPAPQAAVVGGRVDCWFFRAAVAGRMGCSTRSLLPSRLARMRLDRVPGARAQACAFSWALSLALQHPYFSPMLLVKATGQPRHTGGEIDGHVYVWATAKLENWRFL